MTTLDFAGEEIHDARLFVGTSVVSGTGSALVTATGARTSGRRGTTSRGVPGLRGDRVPGHNDPGSRGPRDQSGLVLPLLDSLLFAIALAVDLTPELLPAIVTLDFDCGAQALSHRGVLR